MNLLKTALSIALLAGIASSASADLVTPAEFVLDFSNAATDFNGNSSFTHAAIEPFNETETTLVIYAKVTNGSLFQVGNNGTVAIDNPSINGGEAMSFSFKTLPEHSNSVLKLTQVDLGGFGSSDQGVLSINGNDTNLSAAVTDLDIPFSQSNLANTFTLTAPSGNSFTLKSVTVQLAAVPEPTAFLFGSLVAGCVGTVVARRRNRVA